MKIVSELAIEFLLNRFHDNCCWPKWAASHIFTYHRLQMCTVCILHAFFPLTRIAQEKLKRHRSSVVGMANIRNIYWNFFREADIIFSHGIFDALISNFVFSFYCFFFVIIE